MKTFNELIQETATDFFSSELDTETVTYRRWLGHAVAGQGVPSMAHTGVLTGTPAAMAAAGVISDAGEAYEDRPITVYVDRLTPAPVDGAPHGHAPVLSVTAQNDNINGIDPTELDLGRDLINLPLRIGQTAQDRPVKGIISQDEGMLVLEVR